MIDSNAKLRSIQMPFCTVKTETMAIQLAEIYVRYRYGERIAEEEKPYLITELPDSWVVEGAKLPYEVAGGVFIIEINKKNGCVLNFLHSK